MGAPVLLSGVLVLMLASGVSAHHPFSAEFDESTPVTITGTVTKFEWKNPHSMVHVDGRDAAGQRGQWTIELGGIDELMKQGWTASSLKASDSITVEGWRAKDGSRLANAKSVKTSGGAMLMAASSFESARPAEGQLASAQTRDAAGTAGELPATAGPFALAGLLGLLSLGGALVLRARR